MKNKLIRTTNSPDLETKRFQDYIVEIANTVANNTIIPQIPTHSLAFSKTEHVVGTWIDGKPLYQKTIESDATFGNWASIPLDVTNIDLLVEYKGFLKNDTSIFDIFFYENASNFISSNISSSNFWYKTSGITGNADAKIVITILYTKAST